MATLADRLFATFDAVYIINLESRPDRLVDIRDQLKRLGTNFDDRRVHRFNAIRPDDALGFPSIGARGCFLSHVGVLREALRAGHARILLFEDDLDFVLTIDRLLAPALTALDRNGFGIFYGGYALPNEEDDDLPHRKPVVAIGPDRPVRLAHFMGFERATMERLLPYLELMASRPRGSADGGPMGVDEAYGWFRADHPDLKTWLAFPQLGMQRPSPADISAAGLLDRLPIPRPARRAMSRVWRRLP